MGIDIAKILASDPAVMRQQAQQNFIAQNNQGASPMQATSGLLGAILGRGIGNSTQGKGFFEVNDPRLQQAQTIRNVVEEAVKEGDISNPADVYSRMSEKFLSMGMVEAGAMAAQQAQKAQAEIEKANMQRERFDMDKEKFELDKKDRAARGKRDDRRLDLDEERVRLAREKMERDAARQARQIEENYRQQGIAKSKVSEIKDPITGQITGFQGIIFDPNTQTYRTEFIPLQGTMGMPAPTNVQPNPRNKPSGSLQSYFRG